MTDDEIRIRRLEAQVALFAEHSQVLGELVEQVEEDILRTEGTKHLWQTIDEANELLMGPTRAYVNQD
tara:strand:+ start:2540 stop:2743 length:204 start_codon:yes stop_codon:yes gene_type:complete